MLTKQCQIIRWHIVNIRVFLKTEHYKSKQLYKSWL